MVPGMTKPFNVRMGPELRSDIEERVVAGEASNASEWAREALAGVIALGGLPKLSAALDLQGRNGDLTSPHPARALQLQRSTRGLRVVGTTDCQHPVDRRITTPFEVRCGVCRCSLDPDTNATVGPPQQAPTELRVQR